MAGHRSGRFDAFSFVVGAANEYVVNFTAACPAESGFLPPPFEKESRNRKSDKRGREGECFDHPVECT